jgi:Ca2+-transporting ATPase
MTFVVMGLGTVFNALTNRRDPASGLTPPILQALGVSLVPVAMIFLATQLPSLQHGMLTLPLTGPQWLEAIGLALVLPVVIEGSKWLRRRRVAQEEIFAIDRAVTPGRGLVDATS